MSDSQMAFDEARAKGVLSWYRGQAIRTRREYAFGLLDLNPGERLLDVGSGPGLFAVEASDRVGPTGSVVGVDIGPDMLAIAERVREESPNKETIEFRQGHATEVPVEDADFDVAVSIQVLEYVEDVDKALSEIHRALRPGGRVLIWDTDWGTVTAYTEHPARHEKIMRAYEEHCQHVALPQTLAPRLRAAGFEPQKAGAYSILDIDGAPDGLCGGLEPLIKGFVIGHNGVTEADVEAWAAERQRLKQEGRLYFSLTASYFVATKPG